MTVGAEQNDGDRIGSFERFLETDLPFCISWSESGSSRCCAVSLGDEQNPFLPWACFLVDVSDNDGGKQSLPVWYSRAPGFVDDKGKSTESGGGVAREGGGS